MITGDLMLITLPYYFRSDHCGYCSTKKEDYFAIESFKSKRIAGVQDKIEHVTIGAQVEQMSYKQYDELINQGFRRSGTFMYKQDLLRNCCRLYTIRTRLQDMKLTKQHRKTVNRFVRAIGEAEDNKNSQTFDLESLVRAESHSSRFYTRMEPSKFSKAKFELYKKYQIRVHNDDPEDITQRLFKRFLCDNPFPDHATTIDWQLLSSWTLQDKDQLREKFEGSVGSVHECYYLDDKMIAISVMDILPSGISSIYFIWDPDYPHLSLGTLSGIREVLMASYLGLPWYYLGYYIDDCPKMVYKLKFGGELLDLCNEKYYPLSMVKEYIKDGRFFVIGDKNEPIKEPSITNSGYPVSGDSGENIANELYGDEGVYEEAENEVEKMQQQYGVLKTSISSAHDIPSVVPGLVPMWRVRQWINNGILGDEFYVRIFDSESHRFVEGSFNELNGPWKRAIVDSVRLFGLNKVKNSILLA